jgi:hypothetical protein
MSWNYRVVRTKFPNGEEIFGIHEMYYDPDAPTVDPVPIFSDSIDGLRSVLDRMREALDKPVIE